MAVSAARTRYDGVGAFPAVRVAAQTARQRATQVTVTGLIVVGPFAGLAAAIWLLWGHGVGWPDLGLALFFYLLTGFGVTVGFHRCLTHRSFTARPALRIALVIAGSMSFEGNVIGWVATHRRHHALTDRLIRVFERVGWASAVHWPNAARLDQHRCDAGEAGRVRVTGRRMRRPAAVADAAGRSPVRLRWLGRRLRGRLEAE